MSFSVHPITPTFAAEIGDLDAGAPLSDADFAALDEAFNTYSVLIFPGQQLSDDAMIEFSARFGPLEATIQELRKGVTLRLRPEFADTSNLDANDELLAEDGQRRHFNSGNQLWHTDSSFRLLPAKASLLYGRSIPPTGGQTEFADLRAAYDALPEAMQARLEGLVAEHSITESRAKIGYDKFTAEELEGLPRAPQVVVRTHAGSGRRTLYLASHAGRIFGMDDDAGKALLAELIAHATQRQFVYSHRWRAHDLVMWDNCCTMHRGRPFDDLRYARDMRRTTVEDVAPTCEQEGIPAEIYAA
jgi:alpha-ketoglutarate-dependent 2,4-dichlorophenoxyacetate dioxygenase